MLDDLGCPLGAQPSEQGRARRRRDHHGGAVAEGLGGNDARDAGVAAGRGVEVWWWVAGAALGGGLADAAEEVVADAAGLEGARGLQVVELEEDSASTI